MGDTQHLIAVPVCFQQIIECAPAAAAAVSLRLDLVVAVFTFRTKERLTNQRIKEEVVRKARHVLKGAVLAA